MSDRSLHEFAYLDEHTLLDTCGPNVLRDKENLTPIKRKRLSNEQIQLMESIGSLIEKGGMFYITGEVEYEMSKGESSPLTKVEVMKRHNLVRIFRREGRILYLQKSSPHVYEFFSQRNQEIKKRFGLERGECDTITSGLVLAVNSEPVNVISNDFNALEAGIRIAYREGLSDYLNFFYGGKVGTFRQFK